MPNFNNARLGEDIKREISAALHDIKDKRIAEGIVTVSHTELTSDLSYCKVYISSLGGAEKTAEAVECCKNAAGFFKKHINAHIKMRKIPELVFLPDNSLEHYQRVSSIMDKLAEERKDENKQA